MTESKVKDSPQKAEGEEKDSLRNSTAVFKSYLEDLEVLFQSIERSPDRPERERELLQTSSTWSMVSSPLVVVFQTDESSCSSTTSQQSVEDGESSVSDEGAETEDDNNEEGYEADTSNLLDDEIETEDKSDVKLTTDKASSDQI